MSSVRDSVFSLLDHHGMTTVFGNPGSTEMGFLNDMPQEFRYILGLQEAVVVSMADGYAQATDGPVLVNLHSAPGVGNAMGSIVNARANRTPLVITAGTQARPMHAMEAFLTNVDGGTLPRPAVKWAGEAARAQDTAAILARAIHEATLPPPGPVFVSQPMDDWDGDVVDAETRHLLTRQVSIGGDLNPSTVGEIVDLLRGAESPLIILGAALDRPQAWHDTVVLAEATGAAVMMAPLESRWSFPGWHPQFRGVLAPAIAPATAQLSGHDVVVVLGAPVFRYYPYLPGELLPDGTRLVHITDDPGQAARAPMGSAVVADPVAAARLLATAAATAGSPPASPEHHTEPLATSGPAPLRPTDVFTVLAAVSGPDLAMVNESASNLSTLFECWRPTRPRSLFFSGSGGLGFGAAAAVGVQLGMPDRPVLAVVGDGALQYSVQGLYTAAQYQIPVTFLVMRNQQYAILKWFGEQNDAPDVPGLDLPDLDSVKIAEGYGVPAQAVRETGELEAALRSALAADGPRLIEVDIEGAAAVM